jgi:hypothetical protein
MVTTGNGRQVFICTRTNSQTINICEANNRRGDYDWIVRLFQPEVATEAEISEHATNPESLVGWLKDEKHGEVEKKPPPDLPPAQPPGAPNGPFPAREEDPWIQVAVSIVEVAIDQLVREFLRVPYLHRVEHSLHARPYSILAAQPHFARELPLQNPMFLTQPLHKEWPETIPEENTRRGNFDLAVLTPNQLAGCTVYNFRHGNLPAPIAIEMGLDYGPAHLAADRDKLIHSQVPHGYLVHLTRIGPHEQANAIILEPGGNGGFKTAYACVAANAVFYKLVNGNQIVNA